MSQKDTTRRKKEAVPVGEADEFPLPPTIHIVSVDERGLKDILLKLRSSERWIADLAPKLGVSPQLLGDVLAGRRPFGPKLLRGMGVVRAYKMYDVEIIADE